MIVVGATHQYLAETWQLAAIEDLLSCHASLKLHFPKRTVSTYLISPGHINKSSQWLIEPLAEVLENKYCDQSDSEFRYVLKDGRSYLYGRSDHEIQSMPDSQIWKRLF